MVNCEAIKRIQSWYKDLQPGSENVQLEFLKQKLKKSSEQKKLINQQILA